MTEEEQICFNQEQETFKIQEQYCSVLGPLCLFLSFINIGAPLPTLPSPCVEWVKQKNAAVTKPCTEHSRLQHNRREMDLVRGIR